MTSRLSRRLGVLLLVPMALCLLRCAPRTTDITISKKPLPKSFGDSRKGPSVGTMAWRSYFADDRLVSLISSALAENPDVRIALQRIELARAYVQQATGALLPKVFAGAGVGIQKYGRYTPEGAGNTDTEIAPGQRIPTHVGDFALGLQATWEIDAWGRLRSERQSAVARYLATVEGTSLVMTGLVADVATAYYGLLALDQTHHVLEQTVIRQQEALEVVRVQKLAGRANELAVQQFEAQVAEVKAMEAETAFRIREAENGINLLRGSYPQPIQRERVALLRDPRQSVATGVPSELLQNRPDVRAAEFDVQATQFDVKAARAAFFPSFDISAGVGFRAFNPRFLFATPESAVYSAGGSLIAPLVNRSAIEAQFAAAKASQVQAMYNYQKTILNAFVEVANGLAGLERGAKVVALRKEQKAAVEQTVTTADMLYRAGKANYLEVLMAQQRTLTTELELIGALREQHLASIFIFKALGGGWR